ncbi:DUF2127 domain-containing protein [Lysobacter hankyongensis]|uniref:DUF2127 domain-containing protein n=1 Tax=Lysobacter hankyongensis TaxID=1176535 RepID=A0ABP9BAM8_9GAMM
MRPTSVYDPSPRAHPGLHVIALIELGKGMLASASAIALAAVGPAPIRAVIASVGERLHFDPHHSALGRLLVHITPDTVLLAATAIGVYAALRFVLFYGLWRVRAWASWLGAFAAALYVPFCVYALWRYPGWPTLAVLMLNLAIVGVLVRDLMKRRRAARLAAP